MVLALLRDNDYHSIMLDEIIQEKGLEVHSIQTNDPRDVQQYRYPRLQSKILVVVDTENHEVSLALRGANKVSYDIIQKVPKYMIAHPETEKLPILKTYDEQIAFFEERIVNHHIKFEKKDVKQVMLKNLVRTPTAYRQLLTLKESLQDTEKVTMDNVEDIFGEVDFYNLTDVLVDAILGNYRRRTIQRMQYFTDYKEFSPRWLGGKLVETAVTLDYFYQLVNKGVLITPKRLDDIRDRIRLAGLSVPIEFPSIREQYTYLNTVKEIPYKEVKPKIEKVVRGQRIEDEVGLYGILTDLRRKDDE